jgi:hypothetical protein
MATRFNKEKTRNIISLVMEKIKTETDSRLLDEYQSLFKKEVSILNRSRAAAYLLMLCDNPKTLRGLETDRVINLKDDTQSDSRHNTLKDEESVQLFFNAGRNRRVFLREVLGLINAKTAVPREDIGAIRILENYSFLQVREGTADKIIEALNGVNFRGRPLKVNYAKPRSVPQQDSEQNQYNSKEEKNI